MHSSPEEAKRIFSKWMQDSRKIVFMSTGPPINFVASGFVEQIEGDFLTISNREAGLTVILDLDGADFEYLEPTDRRLPVFGLPAGKCVCSLSIGIDEARRTVRERFGVVRLLLCELTS